MFTELSERIVKKYSLKREDNPCMEFSYKVKFPNGYGVSIIKGASSYGGKSDLWEVACLKDNHLVYNEDFGYDVLGYLSDSEVEETINLVQSYSN